MKTRKGEPFALCTCSLLLVLVSGSLTGASAQRYGVKRTGIRDVLRRSWASRGSMDTPAKPPGVTLPIDVPLWRVQEKPSLDMPFVFFHQRKAGGSSWRSVIYDSAFLAAGNPQEVASLHDSRRRAKIKSFPVTLTRRMGQSTGVYMPCYTVSCGTWQLPNAFDRPFKGVPFFIFAGHFHWSAVRQQFGNATFQRSLRKGFVGLTNFREPISRVVSCLQYRFPKRFPSLKSIRATSLEDFEMLLRTELSAFGFGCNNEPLRLLSGHSDEEVLNQLGMQHNNALAHALVEECKKNILSGVVIALMEYPDESMAVVDHYLPWVFATDEQRLPHLKSSRKPRKHLDIKLSHGHLAIIRNLNWPEFEVYEFAEQLLKQEYQKLNSVRTR